MKVKAYHASAAGAPAARRGRGTAGVCSRIGNVKVALAQTNPTTGDFAGNLALILAALHRAEAEGADLLVSCELGLCGYPPRDLLERPVFIEGARRALAQLTERTGETAVIVGFPERLPDGAAGRRIANSAALLHRGRLLSVHRKSLLPTYDVFDEWRYFEPATSVSCAVLGNRRIGISVCEDIWNDADFWPQRLYRDDPIEKLVAEGAELIVNISACPYSIEKRRLIPRMLRNTAQRWRKPLVFVNQVGGQDDLVFAGSSLVLDQRGEVVARAAEHDSDYLLVDLAAGSGPQRPFEENDVVSALHALVLGTRDYARRCGFSRAVLGLSGGVDSALVACIAARALGPGNVLGVAMPSRYSSPRSLEDAAELAANLGIGFQEIPIEPVFGSYLETLAPVFAGLEPDVTEENLQARVRGALLMALSNKLGSLVLSTGNKSELATGYCTLYGDMCGGLAVISDVPKTLVYALARAVNQEKPVIPLSTLTRPPSAELSPGQTDQDSLPPYDLLDAILHQHLQNGLDREALVAGGFPPAVVDQVVAMVLRSEYKRRQAPPGLRITGKAFGPGRRYPIAHSFQG
jgi:NAD+ synthase (glutamine-hydrolysing)